ncbi:vesicle transport V-SNARE protein amine-terminal protein (macronuclear) [Tetrahymena thermophila SB210]|uniref:Vesicle transport V-SNARE protein amine-terminal protein n=1 Tax=Tetrahymena thermophila (strain SB210) TaxID=312017 RepID=I7MIN7_TETTS|nr:vesicle transport V-SNARE protein amine-terminal protein [Tetrahymena thermophila SB210]EAR93887.1 vesicle transport V-SNARE protein amine-terminal protein [Tetrahymena thermophila SB210]|eukprot:XP_001014132.1 vesicle transport V-SNARE protein amine-terminal protein [Tetrahymena thermophila SB210]
MADIEDLRAGLVSQLEKLEKEIGRLDSKDPVSRNKSIKKLNDFVKEVESDLKQYETEVLSVSVKQAQKYQESLKQLNAKYENLKKSFEQKKIAGTDRERLFRGIKKMDDRDPSEMQTEEVIQRLKETQENDIEALLGIQGHVERFNEMADNINAQLDDQIRKLDQVNAIAKDTESELKRTQRFIRQFLRNIYTDKILICLIVLIFIAIVTLLILNITGITKKLSNNVDVVTKSNNNSSNSSSSGTNSGGSSNTNTGKRFLNYGNSNNQVQVIKMLGEFIMSILI